MRMAHRAYSLGPSGDDLEHEPVERDGLKSRSVPRFALLRARCLGADPLARLPLSLPKGRW
jgi:hypothetical protein